MAQHDGDNAAAGSAIEKRGTHDVPVGTAVISSDAIENPGLPPHQPRVTDLDPKKEKGAERRVIWLFLLSMVGTVFAIFAYIAFPIEPGNLASTRVNNLLVGLGLSVALIPIGIGAVLWAKSLMKNDELVEERHPTRGTEETRAAAAEVFRLGNEESGFGRRKLLRNTLIGAVAIAPLPGVVMLRDLAPAGDPVEAISHTMWKEGTRLARDGSGTPILASDVTIGSVFHVVPEGLDEVEHRIEEKAKAAVLLMRLNPEDFVDNITPGRENWHYHGIVAFSKICTHVGCPVALYEQQTHHLLCPCHQSTFDVADGAKVVFGPAKRALPQLPITVDDEGYLIATDDFSEPIGPSFWERVK